MLNRSLLALCFLLCALPASAQDEAATDSTVRAKVHDLLVLTKTNETTQMYIDNVLATLEQQGSTSLLKAFRKDFTVEAMTEMIVDIYAKHFTAEEIDEIAAFYDSPFGQKYIALRPVITQETIAASQAWVAEWIAEYEAANP
jgi:hypothetical protein